MSTEQQINEQIEQTGKVDPIHAAALLEMVDAELTGETVPGAESGNEPGITQEQVADPKAAEPTPAAAPPSEDEMNAENAVVLAKDGKHTIPFEKLAAARDEAKEWRQKFEEQQAQLAALQEANPNNNGQPSLAENNLQTAQALIEASGNDADVIELFGDFSEQAIANAVQTLVQKQLSSQVSTLVQQQLNQVHQEQQTLTAQEQHFKTISDAHPDWTSVVESSEFDTWMKKQPSYVQDGINQVFQSGTAQQVNQVLSDYKTQNNLLVSDPVASIKEAAKQAVSNARSQVPHSLSDLPAGAPAAVSREERLANLSGPELIEEMATWTQEQIDAYTLRNA